MEKDKIDSIIFDLDGTLWDSTDGICDAWQIILDKHPEIKRQKITRDDLEKCMGLPMYDIAAKLFVNETEEVQKSLMDEMSSFENKYLEKRGGVLYDGLKETLEILQKNYKLYIVSNCQDGYIEAFIKAHNMQKYFLDTECWGRTFLTKGENNKMLIERNGLKNPVYVGDTQKDAQSAKEAGIPFVYAAYGFGDVSEYDYYLDKITRLPAILNQDIPGSSDI